MHAQSYLRSATDILQQYDGASPFAGWLKKYFAAHKKHGSRDRRWISHLCYCFFRMGKSGGSISTEGRITTGLYLVSTAPNPLLEELDPALNANAGLPLAEKIAGIDEIQPLGGLASHLSKEINASLFSESFFIQPDLHLRIRPGQREKVLQKLEAAGLGFEEIGEDGLALPNTTKVDSILDIDREVVVQDRNSQRVLDAFMENYGGKELKAWDCCAASGGKSILLLDHFPKARLTVSDIRENILHNLRNRFERAGIKSYRSRLMDLAAPDFSFEEKFDLVICDAPCSGSGTWSRTPEQLHYFREEEIGRYSGLQEAIAGNAAKSLRSGGYFLYITCSVFEKENEAVVQQLLDKSQLQLVSSQYHQGYEMKADTLFSGLFCLD